MSLRLRQPAIVQQLRTESSEYLEASLIDQPEEYDAIAGIDDPSTLLEWTRKSYPGLIENVGMSFFRDCRQCRDRREDRPNEMVAVGVHWGTQRPALGGPAVYLHNEH
jgi:hypothetical protein